MGEHEDLNISSATSCLVSYNSILAQMFRYVLVEKNLVAAGSNIDNKYILVNWRTLEKDVSKALSSID